MIVPLPTSLQASQTKSPNPSQMWFPGLQTFSVASKLTPWLNVTLASIFLEESVKNAPKSAWHATKRPLTALSAHLDIRGSAGNVSHESRSIWSWNSTSPKNSSNKTTLNFEKIWKISCRKNCQSWAHPKQSQFWTPLKTKEKLPSME